MSTGYQVIGPYVNGDVISATLFNNDFGAIAAAMHQTTGHDHDGTTGGGAPIAKIGDADFNNKIEIDGTNNQIKMFLEVGGSSTEVLDISENNLSFIANSGPQLNFVNTDETLGYNESLGAINFYNSDPSGVGPHNVAIIEAKTRHSNGYGADLFFKVSDGLTSTATAMIVNHSGTVLVGTNYPNPAFTTGYTGVVMGGHAKALQASGEPTDDSNPVAAINRLGTDGQILALNQLGDELGSFSSDGDDFVITNERDGDRLILQVRAANGATDYRIGLEPDTSSGAFKPLNADSDDYFDLGSSTERFRNLHLSGAATAASLEVTGGDLILRSDSDDADTQYIRFENYPTDIRTAYIRADYTSQTAGGGTSLAFGSNDHATATDTDSMVIDIEGNVGIGTTSPYYKLDVRGASASSRITSTSGDASLHLNSSVSDSCNIYFGDSNAAIGAIKYNHSTDKMSFNTNATEQMSIDSNGDVTIVNDLTVDGTIYASTEIQSKGNNVFRIRNNNVPNNPSSIEMYSYSSGLNDIVIRSDSFRTSSDTEKFRVRGDTVTISNVDYAKIENGLYVRSITASNGAGDVSGNTNASSVIHAASGTDKGYAFHGSADSTTRGCRVKLEQDAFTTTNVKVGSIDFVGRPSGGSSTVYSQIASTVTNAAGTEAELKLDSDTLYVTGNVGIGEPSPSEALDVVGNIAVSGTVDGVDIDALNTTVSGKADLSGDTFTGLIEADGGLLIPETSRLEIGSNTFGGDNTYLSVGSNGVTSFYSYNNVIFQSGGNLTLSGTGNASLLRGQYSGGNYEVSLHYGTGQERLITTSGGINVTGDITLTGTVDGIDIDALNTTVSGKADLSGDTFTGHVRLQDDVELRLGDNASGVGDLRIYHSSSTGSSFIKEQGSGGLIIQGESLILSDMSGKDYLYGIAGGETRLFHNGLEKFATRSGGVAVTGDIIVSGTVDGVDIDALNTTVTGKADLSGDTFTGLIEADGGLLIPETADLEIGPSAYGASNSDNTYLSVNSSGVATLAARNNFTIQSSDTLQLSGVGNRALLRGTMIDGNGNYEVSLFYGTSQEKLTTTSDGISVTGDITLTGAVGIGTDDPDYTLQIEAEPDLNNPGPQQYYDPLLHLKALGTETDSILQMSTPALGQCMIKFGDNVADNSGEIEYKHSNNTMWFKASGSNVMKLQNNEVDVYGTLDVNGTVEAKDVIVYESQSAAVSPLLTTDRTVEELADLYVLATSTAAGATQLPTYQHALVNFNATGETVTTLTSAEGPAVTAFVTDSNNNYDSTEQSDYYTYVGASPYVRQSTIIEDIERGDYDYLIAPAKVGINTETPASALDVIGDISVSGNITSDLGLNLTPTNGIEMRAGDANGIEMHWWTQSADASALSSEQTKRFHITGRGVHVGDDVTGTYTAGDLQTNEDIDFGFLVGRESYNYGSNNVGIGFDLHFRTNSASNFAQGSIIDFYGATQNCAAFGGNLDVGVSTDTVGLEHSFIGGHVAKTGANETFTWATGAVTNTGQHYPAVNNGTGSVLFGRQGQIDVNSTYSLLGGRVGPATDFIEPSLTNSSYAFSWGRGNVVDDSNASVVCGDLNSVDGAANALVTGESNTVLSSNAFVSGSGNETTAVDAATAIGKDNTAEGNYSVAIGKDNISLGEAGVCLGQGLKTSIFNQSVTNQPSGPYQWDNYTTVVGGYNNPSYKYLTDHTGSTTWVDNHRFVVGTGTNQFATDNGFIVAVPTSDFSGIIMPALAASTSHADDTAAKAAGVPVGGLYHTNGVVKVVL